MQQRLLRWLILAAGMTLATTSAALAQVPTEWVNFGSTPNVVLLSGAPQLTVGGAPVALTTGDYLAVYDPSDGQLVGAGEVEFVQGTGYVVRDVSIAFDTDPNDGIDEGLSAPGPVTLRYYSATNNRIYTLSNDGSTVVTFQSGNPSLGVYNSVYNDPGDPITFVAPASPSVSITSGAAASGVAGTAGSFNVTTTGGASTTFSLNGAPAGVTVVNNGNGSAALNFDGTLVPGTYNFTVYAQDGGVGFDSQAFTLTVSAAPNQAPTATNLTQSLNLNEDAANTAIGDIVVSDANPGDQITATITLNTPAAGAFTNLGTGAYNAATGAYTVTGTAAQVNAALAGLTFSPAANFEGVVTASARVRDAAGTGPADGTLTFTVAGMPDAPTATNLTQTISATAGSNSAIGDIVVTDPDMGETITATVTLSDPAAGAFANLGTGAYNAGTGAYTVTGTVAQVNAALAGLTFTPAASFQGPVTVSTVVRDAAGAGPAAGTITFNVTRINTAPTDIMLSANTVAENSAVGTLIGTLTATDAQGGAMTYTIVSVDGVSGAGPFSIAGDQLRVNGPLNFEAKNSYTVRVRVTDSDGAGFTKNLTVTVTNVPEAPVVTAIPAVTAPISAPFTFNVSAGDPEGTALTYSAVGLPAGLSINAATGAITGTPTTLQGATPVTVTVTDASGASTTVTFNFTVAAFVNQAPVITSAPSFNAFVGMAAAFTVTATDANGFQDVSFSLTGAVPTGVTLADGGGSSNQATLNVGANVAPGVYTFTINATDGVDTTTQTFTLTVSEILPITINGQEDEGPRTIQLNLAAGQSVSSFTQPTGNAGTVTLAGNVFTFTPTANFNGSTSFTYNVVNGQGATVGTGTVTLNVAGVPDAPIFVQPPALNAFVGENFSFPVQVSDADGDPIMITASGLPSFLTYDAATRTLSGRATAADVGAYEMLLSAGGGEATLRVRLRVWAVRALTAVADTATTMEDMPVAVRVTANDFGSLEGGLELVSVTQPANGTAVVSNQAEVTYTPRANFSGTDTFTYTVRESQGGTVTGTVTVRVMPVNDAPPAVMITSPANGSNIVLAGDSQQRLNVTLAVDGMNVDADTLDYVLQLSTSQDFASVLFEQSVGMNTGFYVTYGDLAQLLRANGVQTGRPVELWARVVTRDRGGLETVGERRFITVELGTLTANEAAELPQAFALKGNYPNPFNPSTTISLDLPASAEVSIEVVDLLGRRVMLLPAQAISAGANRSVQVDAAALASGTYLYRVTAKMANATKVATGRMTLVK